MYKTRFGGRSPHGQERRLKPQPFLCAASQNTAGKVGSECCPLGTSREGQWLRLCTFAAGGTGSIPGWGTKTLPATRHGQENRNTRTNQKVCVASSPKPAVPGGSSGLGPEARKCKMNFCLISFLDILLKYS